MRIPFKGIKDLSVAIPAGKYNALLEKVTKAHGPAADYFKLEFKIVGGDFEGKKLFRNLSLSTDALWAFKQAMINLGTDEDIFEEDDVEVDEVIADRIGATCTLDVAVKEYQGKDTNEVKKILEPDLAY
jgi:hypothetical protein